MRDYGSTDDAHKRWRDIWGAGQGVHATTREQPVAEIVAELETGFHAARDRLARY